MFLYGLYGDRNSVQEPVEAVQWQDRRDTRTLQGEVQSIWNKGHTARVERKTYTREERPYGSQKFVQWGRNISRTVCNEGVQ